MPKTGRKYRTKLSTKRDEFLGVSSTYAMAEVLEVGAGCGSGFTHYAFPENNRDAG